MPKVRCFLAACLDQGGPGWAGLSVQRVTEFIREEAAVVRRSLKRAGITRGRLTGTQMLRHTAASPRVNGGASFTDGADVLGHCSLQTTAIYAKLDIHRLVTVALPWVGGFFLDTATT